jgi:hypothetical protein
MADIEYIKHQIITEIKVDELTGKGTCSIRGTARLADKYLAKINYIFFPKIPKYIFYRLNQILPAIICIKI